MLKVMIVEDEQVIIEGIKHLIDWESMGCRIEKTCLCGEEALAYLGEESVDILISDIKMPGMNGLELIKEVREKWESIKSIVLTAYSDFNYARQAVRYGAVDFIMKNEFVGELPLAIKRAIEAIKHEQTGPETGSNRGLDSQDREGAIAYILESMALSKYRQYPDKINRYGLHEKDYCVCSCEISERESKGQDQQVMKSIEDMLRITLKDYEYYMVSGKGNTCAWVIVAHKDTELEAQKIEVVCKQTQVMMEEFTRIAIRIGVSSTISQVTELHRAYQESNEALSRLADSSRRVMVYDHEHIEPLLDIDMAGVKEDLADAIFTKEYDRGLAILNQLKESVVTSGHSFQRCKVDILGVCDALLSKLRKYSTKEDVKAREQLLYEEVEASGTIYSLFNVVIELVDYCRQVLENQKVVKSYLIGSIDQYISEHYNRGITLDDISEALHVSKSYICRIYKKKVGITLSDGINRYRMDRAKVFLGDPRYKIYEIGAMIGIEDPAYFTTLFKRYVGCSPTEYRNKL